MIICTRQSMKSLFVLAILVTASRTAAAAGVTVTTGKVDGAAGKEVEVPILIKGVKDVKSISGMSIRLKFDPEVLTFKDIKDGAVLPANSLTAKSIDEKEHPGKVGLSFTCGSKSPGSKEMGAVEQDGAVLRVIFTVNEKAASGKKSVLKLDNYRAMNNDVDAIEVPVESEDGEFIVTGGAGLPFNWIWIAIGAGVALLLLIIIIMLASRGGDRRPHGYPMPQHYPPPQHAGGAAAPPRFHPEGANFTHRCTNCGGMIQLPRAMMGQTFQCGACGTTQVGRA